MLRHWSAVTVVAGLMTLTACGEVDVNDPLSPEVALNQGQGNDGPFVRFGGARVHAGGTGNNIAGSGHGRVMPDGSVHGSVRFNNRFFAPDVIRAKGTVDCIVFLNADEAIIGGVITKVIKNWLPFDFEGKRWSTTVRDESAGGGTGSRFFLNRPLTEICSTTLPYGDYSTEAKSHNMVDP